MGETDRCCHPLDQQPLRRSRVSAVGSLCSKERSFRQPGILLYKTSMTPTKESSFTLISFPEAALCAKNGASVPAVCQSRILWLQAFLKGQRVHQEEWREGD